MRFITIEHKGGAIMVLLSDIDYGCYRRERDKYYVIFRTMLDDLELTKEQYESFIAKLT